MASRKYILSLVFFEKLGSVRRRELEKKLSGMSKNRRFVMCTTSEKENPGYRTEVYIGIKPSEPISSLYEITPILGNDYVARVMTREKFNKMFGIGKS